MAIFKLFKLSNVSVVKQREMAEKLYEDNPDLAMRVAMGEEKAPSGILSTAIYAKVCDEAEKSENLEVCRQLANSLHNSKISAEAQKLKFRNSYSAIEKMKEVVNARRETFEKTFPKGKTVEQAVDEKVKELKKYIIFLENFVSTIFSTQKEIDTEIKKIKFKTKQNLKEEQLIRELWILRYTLLHLWFLKIKPPQNQDELKENTSLIDRSFQDIKGTSDYLPWLKKGFIDYAGTDKLTASNLKEFESHVMEKVSGKIPLIAFDCTEGRLAGELHDFVIELLMTTITQDKKVFETGVSAVATEKEAEEIKKVIGELKSSREKAGKDFFEA